MSKHNKPYHNYNNYSANNTNTAPVKTEEPVVEETVETTPVTEEVEQVEVTEIVEESVAPAPAPTMGVVNCSLLRVRAAANTDAAVICNIEEGDEVEVDKDNSTADFYKVVTTAGAEGFCMKKFITIK